MVRSAFVGTACVLPRADWVVPATAHIWNSFVFDRGLHRQQAIANVENLDISTGNNLFVSLKLGLTRSLVCTRSYCGKRFARLLLY